MRGQKHWWLLLLAAALLTASACTENDLDESDANVILEVLSISSPGVQGNIGAGQCSLDPTITCLDQQICADNQAGFCEFPQGDCTITDWSISVSNQALNQDGTISPFNDVIVSGVMIAYTNLDGSEYAPPRFVSIGATIPAGGSGSLTFAPIAFDDLTTDNTTINLILSFIAETVSGDNVDVAGGTGAQLFIEDCIP